MMMMEVKEEDDHNHLISIKMYYAILNREPSCCTRGWRDHVRPIAACRNEEAQNGLSQ